MPELNQFPKVKLTFDQWWREAIYEEAREWFQPNCPDCCEQEDPCSECMLIAEDMLRERSN